MFAEFLGLSFWPTIKKQMLSDTVQLAEQEVFLCRFVCQRLKITYFSWLLVVFLECDREFCLSSMVGR
jgi:hypothetical protein